MEPRVVLQSSLPENAVVDALRRSIDEERRAFFALALSSYAGNRGVIGTISGNSFRVQKRRFWRNDFAPHFYGTLVSEPSGGTRIEGRFDVSPWVKTFMRLWLIGVAVLGGPIFVLSLLDVVTGSHFTTGDAWVGAIIPPAMLVWGFLLPRIGGVFAVGDQQYLVEFLKHTLAAQPAPLAGEHALR